jgi:3-oxoacyl-[acyl-carrier protein] reductase
VHSENLEEPNLLVVFGSESAVVRPLIEEYARHGKVVRVYNKTKPTKKLNCLDTSRISDLSGILESTEVEGPKRIALLGVATVSQQKLFTLLKNEEIDRMIDTNVRSYTQILNAVVPVMLKNRYGRLVYLSSLRAKYPAKGTSIYAASKVFCESLFGSVGREYGRLNITSVSIRMGFFGGRMVDELPADLVDNQLKKVALRRQGSPNELLDAVKFAFTNPYLNGGAIELDGGYSCD